MRHGGVNGLFAVTFAMIMMLFAGCSSDDNPADPGGGGGPTGPSIWFVDKNATGAGDGSSWDDAFIHPADAMDAASAGDQIWVAFGIYYGPGDVTVPVVEFKAGVSLYGGFDGTETNLSQRSISERATFDGGDSLYHVVTGADDALLHGILISNGYAHGTDSSDQRYGGGIYCEDAKMRIARCLIFENSADLGGGGIYAHGDTVVIDSCTISGNEVTGSGYMDSGGGGVNASAVDITIYDCMIYENSAYQGGGLLVFNSMARVTDTDIAANSLMGAYNNGGGVYIANPGASALHPEFVGCRFEINTGGYGGAVCLSESFSHFGDCEFEDNTATMTGSAMNIMAATANIEDCIFDGNDRTAIYVYGPGAMGATRIFNSLFFDNGNTSTHGGAIYNNVVNTVIDCCTIVYNTASNGGGIYSSGACSPVVTNSILWFNSAVTGEDQVNDVGGAETIVTYTDIDQDGYDTGTGNLRSAPLFATGLRGDYYLSHVAAGQASDSPCINAGNKTAIYCGLHLRTTRTDNLIDADQVDLGFHYELGF